MAEQYANLAETLLNGAINNSVTSITVDSATGFPGSASYRIRIDDELLLVTAGAGTTTWTVTRGVETTAAASHLDNAPVTHVLTAAGLTAGIDERVATHAAAADPHAGYALESLYDAKGDIIAASAADTPAKVTVGANNKALVAASGESAGVKWQALDGWFMGVIGKTGRYYSASGGSIGTNALVLNEARYTPFPVSRAITLDRIGVEVTSGGTSGAVIRLGIYNDTGDGTPGTLLLDAGTIDSTTTGFKEITISQAVGPGLYWLVGVAQTASSTARTVIGNSPFVGDTSGSLLTSNNMMAYYQSSVSGALPGTATPNNGNANPPKVAVRVA